MRFPSIEEMRGSSGMGSSHITYEPYTKINPLGARGLGGNAKIRQIQAEQR